MSYATLYAVSKTCIREVAEFRNGWGTAPILWDRLSRDYLDRRWPSMGDSEIDELWQLSQDPRVPLDWRIAHTMTFDGALIVPERISRAAEACRAVAPLLPEDRVSHWEALADTLQAYQLRGPSILGLGLTCTSVADHWIAGGPPGKRTDLFDAVTHAETTRDKL